MLHHRKWFDNIENTWKRTNTED